MAISQKNLIGDLRQSNALLKASQEQLVDAELFAAIGEMAASIGHDLKSPLQVMAYSLYMIKDKESGPAPGAGAKCEDIGGEIKMIEKQINYMNELIIDLQTFVKRLSPNLVKTDLESLFKDTVSSISVPKNIAIKQSVEQAISVKLDPIFMKRALVNLIVNAVQAMPIGGEVLLKAYNEGDRVAIQVIDNGTGIPEEMRDCLFKPLKTTKAKGTGLGLPAVKRLVEVHQGSIGVESAAGKGTTFTIRLPKTP